MPDVISSETAQYKKMSETPIPKLIVTLAIPSIISMLVSSIYNTADTYFVSRLGTSASGAVGIVFAIMAMYQAVGFMCGQGAGSYVSRLYGEKETEKAKVYGNSSFLMSLILGIIISVVGLIFLNPLLRLLGSTETILPFAKQYAIWIFISGPFLSSSCTLNNLLRYEGRAFYSMIGLSIGGVLNIIGDPIFMFVLGLGVTGAGVSTALSQVVSFLILLFTFFTDKTVMKFKPKYISRESKAYTEVAKLGSPSLVRQGLNSISTILLNRAAMPYGDAAIAAMSIVGRLIFLLASIGIGFGQGMQPVVSFNFGAGKTKRVKHGVYFTLAIGTIILTIFGIIMFIFANPIITWFRDDPEVIEIGTAALRFQCISAIFLTASVTGNMLFQCIGKARTAFFLASLRTGLFFIPLILLLPVFLGVRGVELAQPISDILSATLSMIIASKYLRKL